MHSALRQEVGTHQAELASSTAPVKNENRNRHHMTCAMDALAL